VNTADNQNEVAPARGTGAKVDGGRLTVALPPYSYQMLRLKLS
jgi:alpha-N-arabinofuranosidase